MTLKELVSAIAKEEGKKHQASVGDVREIVGIISDLLWKFGNDDFSLLKTILKNGERRAKRKGKK